MGSSTNPNKVLSLIHPFETYFILFQRNLIQEKEEKHGETSIPFINPVLPFQNFKRRRPWFPSLLNLCNCPPPMLEESGCWHRASANGKVGDSVAAPGAWHNTHWVQATGNRYHWAILTVTFCHCILILYYISYYMSRHFQMCNPFVRHTDPFPHLAGAINFHDIVTMTLDTERLWNWHHHGALWNFYGVLRNIEEQHWWIAASAWPSYNPAVWQHRFFFRIIWCFIYAAQKRGTWIIFNPTCIMLNIQSIISCNLHNRPSLFFAHTFGLQLGWSRSKVCQDAVYFQAATHQLLHTVFGEETKNGLDSGEVNEGQFSCGHFYWSLIRLVSSNYNRSVRSYWYI